jgi:transcriptional regulator with XRE-family HTH domain
VDKQKLGRSIRALRHRLGWRQIDLAARCRMSQAALSRIECGDLGRVSVASLDALVTALGAELDVRIRWRGEELDRLLDATHAAIGESLVMLLTRFGWECAVEVTFWIHGEKGVVDVLAWHPSTGRLLVVEDKSVVPDLQSMLGSLHRKVRLGREIAAQRGWRVTGVGSALVLTATAANRARAEKFKATLKTALPDDARVMRKWLADPSGREPAALWFISDIRVMNAVKRRRVQKPRIAPTEARGDAP